MTVVSQISTSGRFFVGLAATGAGPYTLWASGGPDNTVKLFALSKAGVITPGTPAKITIPPSLPATAGYVTNYNPDAALSTADTDGNLPPLPSGMNVKANPQITFPAGMALSPDGNFLYAACNGDNSVAVIDTAAQTVVKQVPAGYFPYGVAVSPSGLLVNKNFEPEDYPEAGYIFNNAARHFVSFKDYGALVRIEGTDTGTSSPTWLNDLPSGNLGYPVLQADNFSVTSPLTNAGDVTTETQGLGQSYFMNLPILAVLGGNNANGEPRLDHYYPGYNFNISDQRRAQEFNADLDGMIANGTAPQFLYIYLPNDHTGGVQAPNQKGVVNKATTGVQQIADGDAALGMIVNHIMNSPIYYDPETNTGSAIFMTFDDAQSSLDHIHPHRTPLVVVSPFAKPAYTSVFHYSTASVVKTEELLMGLPPNNYGDLCGHSLRRTRRLRQARTAPSTWRKTSLGLQSPDSSER